MWCALLLYKKGDKTMEYPILTIYFIVCMFAVEYLGKPQYKLVSTCCEAEYKSLTRSQNQGGQEPYCLNCKKWCELTEVKETK